MYLHEMLFVEVRADQLAKLVSRAMTTGKESIRYFAWILSAMEWIIGHIGKVITSSVS